MGSYYEAIQRTRFWCYFELRFFSVPFGPLYCALVYTGLFISPSGISDPCGTVAGMVTPKRSMSTEGVAIQVSVLPYRCSICAPLVTRQMSILFQSSSCDTCCNSNSNKAAIGTWFSRGQWADQCTVMGTVWKFPSGSFQFREDSK
jgi:hypothetical protein